MKVWIKALLILAIIIVAIQISAYAATGTWHNKFAIQSMTMEPNMHRGDLILIQSLHRTNIITYEDGKTFDYRSFNDYGDIIAFRPSGSFSKTPLLHRAIFWVENGEEMPNGEFAPYEGYITKGDNNAGSDLALGINPVKPEWIIGVARVRIPYLGYLGISLGIWFSFILYAVIYAIIVGYLIKREKRVS